MKCNRALYLGLDPSRFSYGGELVHCPIIRIVPRPFNGQIKKTFERLQEFTHVIFTSRTSIPIYKEYAAKAGFSEKLEEKIYLCIGKATAQQLEEIGLSFSYIAQEETGEGIVALLSMVFNKGNLFFPRSAQGRTLIPRYLEDRKIPSTVLHIYDTQPNPISLPDLEQFDEIIFTSPSTVHAFFSRVTCKFSFDKCISLGPVTEKVLKNYLLSNFNSF